MRRKDVCVIDILEVIHDLDRVGAFPAKTNTARLLGITVPRAANLLKNAVRVGAVYTYSNSYRRNVVRCCYSLTPAGLTIVNAIRDHNEKYRQV